MRMSCVIFCLYSLFLSPNALLAAEYFVSTTGNDNNDCSVAATPCKHVGAAVGKVTTGGTATIKIACGTYQEQDIAVRSSNAITLEGGWNSNFSEQTCNRTGTTIIAGNYSNHWPALFFINNPENSSKTTLTIRCLSLDGTPSTALTKAVRIFTDNTAQVWLTIQHTRVTGFKTFGIYSKSTADDTGTVSINIEDTVFDHNFSQGSYDGTELVYIDSENECTTTLQLNKVSLINNGNTWVHSIMLSLLSKGSGFLAASLQNTIIAGNQTAQTDDWPTLSIVASDDGDSSLHATNTTITDNLVTASGGGLEAFSSGSAKITINMDNTILKGNHFSSQTGEEINLKSGTDSLSLVADYSMLGTHSFLGNVTYTPSHEVHGDPRLNSAYHLQKGSAAIDTGLCGNWDYSNPNLPTYKRIAPYDDIDGDNRPGFGVILGCDIGADEYKPFPWPMFLPAMVGHH